MIELLSPAGSMEALRAAVQNGANAVYLGYDQFNARMNAKNFSADELQEAIVYCHVRGVAVHLTLNTLVADREMARAADVIRLAATLGVDAFIVQDIGMVQLCREIAPNVAVHASTQMSIHSLEGVIAAAELGCSRVVLSRELPREEIAAICRRSPIEIEVFVHGALCMCYSGQCYLSGVIGRRSGNRGQCAQPCRLPYGYGRFDQNRYPLSLKDNCLIEYLRDLERMGGAFDPPEQGKTMSTLRGSVPVAQFGDYAREFAAYTKGRGRMQLRPAGYRPCREQEAVAAASGYDPARDIDDPASSIFCTHGAGFEVKWDEVDSYAHLPLLNLRRADEPESVAAPRKITRSVADGGAPELEKELLAIFERTYGAIRRRDILPMQALRSDDKRELIRALEPAEEFVLVDGYNILFAWDELKELAKSNLDAARHVLMNLLCNYQGYRGCAVILVFDAYKVPLNLGTVEKYHNIFVVYTKEAETADSYIERVTYELRGRRKVRVATSDNLEQLIILGHGAVRVSAKSFHDEVFGTNEEIRRILQENNRKNR